MATVSPTRTYPSSAAATVVVWSGIVTDDTVNSWEIHGTSATIASLQISGTFNGGTTAVFQLSNDGSTWFTAKDTQGDDVSATAAGIYELSTSARYCRISVTSGSADSITATLVLRG
jgi:streptogramin lyase